MAKYAYNLSKKDIGKVLSLVDMEKDAHRKIGNYSLGMKQRLGIAISLLHDPKLIILDEPTNGLDPNGIKEIRTLMIRLQQEFNKTIFVSSHLLSEVEKFCTHVGIINQGSMIFQGKLSDLRSVNNNMLCIETSNPFNLAHYLKKQNKEIANINGNTLEMEIESKEEIPAIVRYITYTGLPIYQLSIQNNTNLEDSFFDLLKQ
jgi:ABC-2 type transport system ATP-binding protein